MKKVIILTVIFSILILTACSQQLQTGAVKNTPQEKTNSLNTIEITSEGFNPKELKVNVGEIVTFVNNDIKPHWPASAFHPTHTAYPGSDIQKCGTEEQIFDACKSLEQSESFSFKFEAPGKWNYHDHLKPSMYGSIIVE